MLEFHLELNGKRARVGLHGLPVATPKKVVKYATGAGEVTGRCMITGIRKNLKTDYAALRDGDPEIDLGLAGRPIDIKENKSVYFDASSEAPCPIEVFEEIDIFFDASGAEKFRLKRKKLPPNINDDDYPIKATRRIPMSEALTKFAPKITFQLTHVNAQNFNFLREFAEELIANNEVARVGAGPNGNLPIVLRANSSKYNGFLIGKAAPANSYQLLIVLSDQELKLPAARVVVEGNP